MAACQRVATSSYLHDNDAEGRGTMSAADHLGSFNEGWTNGNADKIIGSLSDDSVLDDPNVGKVWGMWIVAGSL